jgi:hypothetical protein
VTRKKTTLTPKQKIKVLLIELDYHLVCLFDAMGADDKKAATSEKRILRTLRKELEVLGYFEPASEEQGI